MADSSWEHIYQEDMQKHIRQHGMIGIQEYLELQLGRWSDIELNVGITGHVGCGKSSFINTIRGLNDDDEGAAETGVNETTKEVAVYEHPTNKKIHFWDLPGIGTAERADLETYSDTVGLEKYETFLILSSGPFTANDLLLAKKVESMGKSFFFVRTKIDQDVKNESRKRTFNEETTLSDIRKHCLDNLENVETGTVYVFLISNHITAKWDFTGLTQAILNVLSRRHQESLTLSLNLLTTLSEDLLIQKVKILRGRIWMVAASCAASAAIASAQFAFELSVVGVDVARFTEEINFYKSQLGLPDEKSCKFRGMSQEKQENMREVCSTGTKRIASLLQSYANTSSNSSNTEFARYIPFIGSVIAGSVAFVSTYRSLKHCLNELEEVALAFLDDMKTRVADNFDIN